MIILPIKEKILMYLNSIPQVSQKSQKMVENALGASHHMVSESLEKLKKEKFVKEQKGYIEGEKRKVKLYSLTEEGRKRANEIEKRIGNETIIVTGLNGKEKKIKFSKVNDFLKKTTNKGFTATEILNILDRNRLEVGKLIRESKENIDFAGERPEIKHFYGREKEIKEINDFMGSQSKILSIKGIAGTGKTVLIVKALEKYKHEYNIFWYRFHEFSTSENILRYFSDFLALMGKKRLKTSLMLNKTETTEATVILEEELKNIKAILVFDDTHKIKSIPRIFFGEFLQLTEKVPSIKVIVSGRWIPKIYDKKNVLDKIVREITITGLDKKSSEQILNEKGIKTGIEKIYTITKGHPLMLELIRSEETMAEEVYSFLKNELYDNLSANEKEILNLCSVFRFPFKNRIFLENNMSIDVVDNLVDKSLMQRSSDTYDEHDMIRGFFYKRQTEREKIRYHRIAGSYYEKEIGEGAVLETMYHYVSADYQEIAAKLLAKHGERLIEKGYMKEAIDVLKQLNEKRATEKVWAKIQTIGGDCYNITGGYNEALKYYYKALNIYEKIKDNKKMVNSYQKIANIEEQKGEWEKALENYKISLSIAEKNNYLYGITEGYYGVGGVSFRKGELDTALYYLRKVVKASRKNKYHVLEAKAWKAIGVINTGRGEYDNAIRAVNQSIKILQNLGESRYEIVKLYYNLATVYWYKRMIDEAFKYYENVIKIADNIGLVRMVGYGYLGVSWCYIEKKEADKALDFCNKSIHIFKGVEDKHGIASSYECYGNIFTLKKDWNRTTFNFNECIKINKGLGSIEGLSDAHYEFAKMYEQKGDTVKAKTQYMNALKCYEKLGNKPKIKEIEKELTGLP